MNTCVFRRFLGGAEINAAAAPLSAAVAVPKLDCQSNTLHLSAGEDLLCSNC